jgi:Transposase
VKSNKNDFIDAEAIAEAVDRENMRFVPIKTEDQLDLQALHRVRDRLMARRTSLINQIRAFLLERGIVFAKSPIRLREALPEVLENVNENLTPRMRNLVAMLWSEWKDEDFPSFEAFPLHSHGGPYIRQVRVESAGVIISARLRLLFDGMKAQTLFRFAPTFGRYGYESYPEACG